MSVARRLAEYFGSIDTTLHQVAKRCGFPRGSLDKMLRKGGGLHSDTLSVVLTNYPDLDADWVLLGIGEMTRQTPRPSTNTSPVQRRIHRKKPTEHELTQDEIQSLRQLLRKKGADESKRAG